MPWLRVGTGAEAGHIAQSSPGAEAQVPPPRATARRHWPARAPVADWARRTCEPTRRHLAADGERL